MFSEREIKDKNSVQTAKAAGRGLGFLKMLLPYLRNYKWRFLGAFVALTLAAGMVLGLGQGLRILIDRGISKGDSSMLDTSLLCLVGVTAVLALASFSRSYLVAWIGERLSADLRKDVYDNVVRLDPAFFENHNTGEIISRFTSDAAVLQTVFGSGVSTALRNAMMLAGGLVMLAITSPKLTGLVMLVVPMVILPIIFIGKIVRRRSRATQDKVGHVGGHIDETLHAAQTVQAFNRQDYASRSFAGSVEDAFNFSLNQIKARATLSSVVIFITFGAVCLILWTGGHDVLAGRITAGQLSAFVFYSVLVAGSVGALSEIAGDIQRAAGATERLFELMHMKPGIIQAEHPVDMPEPARGKIAFEDVGFSYPTRPGEYALDHVSFDIKPGETVAIVGPSGAGKSTIFHLLLRFYDPQSGTITVDGVDVRDALLSELRARIAIVPQEPVIFSDTATQNIRFGRPGATHEEVMRVAEAAHAAEFIETLPNGYDTILGERGSRLSGGQKQRIAIARALLRDPAILLLDEATSALDSHSEKAVHSALEKLMKGRTTLIIAHRLATVKNADRILVMEKGRIVDSGTHRQLTRRGGLYAQLARMQFNTDRDDEPALKEAAE